MAKKTAKYVAAAHTARELKIRPSQDANILYEALESKGWWWKPDTGVWTNEARPRGRKQSLGLETNAPDLVQFRIELDKGRARAVAELLQKTLTEIGWQTLQISDLYDNRDSRERGRVYMAFIAPERIVTVHGELIEPNE